MHAEDNYGLIIVRSIVQDASGPAAALAQGTPDGRHVVEVENWATYAYDVEVESEFPQHSGLVDFNHGSGSVRAWTAEVWQLAQNEVQSVDCGLAVAGRSGTERLHCVSVRWVKSGRHRWKSATSNLPLGLAITVR